MQHPAKLRRRWPVAADRLPLAMAAFAAIVWVLRYASRFGLHLSRPPQWAGHFDQNRYIASAHAFAQGDLTPLRHWYPLPYSLVAAPFAWVLPDEPFFVPDLLLFAATAYAFAVVMRRLGIGPVAATLLLLVGDMAIGRIAKLWMVPWTTSLSAPLIWATIAQVLAIVDVPADRSPPAVRAMRNLGLLAAALPLVRPTDALLGGLAVLFVMVALRRQRRLERRGAGALVAAGLALCAAYGLLYLAIYGWRATAYMRAAAVQGFAFADLPWKSYVVLVSAAPWYPASPSLVEAMPWIVPGGAGLMLGWARGGPRARATLALIALLAVPYAAIFLAYTDLQPPGLWTFSNAHYFKWLFPLFAVGAWLWLRSLRSLRGARDAAIALAVAVAPALVRPVPVAVADEVPARMLLFRGATDRAWDSAYFAPATITDARGKLNNVGRFHQVPDDRGERAIAVWRLFVGPATRSDPGEPARHRAAERPYARYATGLSIGVPCWVRSMPVCRLSPVSRSPGG